MTVKVYLEDKQLVTPDDIPVATSNTNGIARPDGTTIVINNGVISLAGRRQVNNNQEK